MPVICSLSRQGPFENYADKQAASYWALGLMPAMSRILSHKKMANRSQGVVARSCPGAVVLWQVQDQTPESLRGLTQSIAL